jgi:hypothetical protein
MLRTCFHRPIDHQRDLVDLERLGDVLVGAALHRAHGNPLGAVCRQQDDRQRLVAFPDGLYELHTIHLGHRIVGDHRVDSVEPRECLRARSRQDGLVLELFREPLQGEEHRRLVIHEE